jgi:hypothetical protein
LKSLRLRGKEKQFVKGMRNMAALTGESLTRANLSVKTSMRRREPKREEAIPLTFNPLCQCGARMSRTKWMSSADALFNLLRPPRALVVMHFQIFVKGKPMGNSRRS